MFVGVDDVRESFELFTEDRRNSMHSVIEGVDFGDSLECDVALVDFIGEDDAYFKRNNVEIVEIVIEMTF